MSIERLKQIGDRVTLKGLEMQLEGERFAALASRHEDGTAPRAVSSFNLFQTPPEIAARMVALLPDLDESARILEPSAGLGRIFNPLRARFPRSQVTLVEQSNDCAGILYRISHGCKLKVSDFLQLSLTDLGGEFDAVVMNPPFKMGRDIKHILHAREMLKPGGLLISLCYDGSRQNSNLRPLCSTWEQLPSGSFKSEGTRANVVLLTMEG